MSLCNHEWWRSHFILWPLIMHAGVRIISEPALITMSKQSDHYAARRLDSALPHSVQDAFWKLHDCVANQGPSTAAGILQTNSFGFGFGDKPTHSGILITSSRFNHSCAPNCVHVWNGNLNTRTISTAKAVKCGEELTLTYTDLEDQDWHSRQNLLQKRYNFACSCEVGD